MTQGWATFLLIVVGILFIMAMRACDSSAHVAGGQHQVCISGKQWVVGYGPKAVFDDKVCWWEGP